MYGDQLLIVNMVLLCFMLIAWSINIRICLESVLRSLLSNCGIHLGFDARNGESWPLVTDEPIDFEKYPVGSSRLQENYWRFKRNLWSITHIKKTCNQLDLETLGFQPIMPKRTPWTWFGVFCEHFNGSREFCVQIGCKFLCVRLIASPPLLPDVVL